MNKYEKVQLADYKRSNKERKAKMLAKWGYKTQEEYFKAIKHVPGKKGKVIKVSKPVKVKKADKVSSLDSDVKPLDYVIAFDTTGSMNSYISSVKRHVKQLIGDLFKNSPNLRMKIVAFGDYCDMESATSFGKAYQTIEMTTDELALSSFVDRAQSTGGGDTDEFYELVIRKINEETDWREGVQRSVLFIADCEPHPLGYSFSNRVTSNQIDWKVEAGKASALGIQYDTLKIISANTWYNELSQITGGVCMDFKNSEKISQVVEGTVYARTSKAAFAASYTTATASGDTELIGAYKTMSTLTGDDTTSKK